MYTTAPTAESAVRNVEVRTGALLAHLCVPVGSIGDFTSSQVDANGVLAAAVTRGNCAGIPGTVALTVVVPAAHTLYGDPDALVVTLAGFGATATDVAGAVRGCAEVLRAEGFTAVCDGDHIWVLDPAPTRIWQIFEN